MDLAVFKKSAAYIAQRNVSERVVRVLANFNSDDASLKLVYCTEAKPTNDDWEDCELTCGELLAEFSEIIIAETDCRPIESCPGDNGLVVFAKQ